MITIKEAESLLKGEYFTDNFLQLLDDELLPDFQSDRHEVIFNNKLFNEVTQLGTSNVCDLTIYEVILKDGYQNRRVAITQEMFKILRGQGVSNAIVSFVNEDKKNFRFSLLTSKYEFEGDKIVKVLSNPRRYSYSLGDGTKTKTAYDFLISKGKVNSLEELRERFSVEVVNKQFYSEIAIAFTKLVGGERNNKKYERQLKLQSTTAENKYKEFAVRLIGRLVFCWFLKEKKSENNVPLLPPQLLTSQYVSDNPKEYYHDVLEPLFFELLNTDQNRRKDKYAIEEIYKQIPYLNGGLFSPHADDKYKYSAVNEGGSYGIVTIPNQWFVEFFDVLSQYNFTVDENTSYDIELSIDPEMLGRIFENLLAEINPETGENAKKSTGSFYTPRDIVDYMVDTSLLEYLKTKTNIDETRLRALISYCKEDDEIANFSDEEKTLIIDSLYTITTLDPACGSGAFPMGMLQKIVYVLEEVDPTATMWLNRALKNVGVYLRKELEKKFNSGSLNYIRKLSIIQNSIFGIDIQPIAVEIARLRCFLSLIIEEKVDDNEPNRGINPLPNLDFKFICANSLISLGKNSAGSMFEKQEHIDDLKSVRDDYFAAESAQKEQLKYRFLQIQKEMYEYVYDTRILVASDRYESLFRWKPFEHSSTNWFDPEWMFGIKNGFDIVIANPPYLDSENMTNSGLGTLREYISRNYKFCKGNWDIYIAFFEKSFDLLNNSGILIFITPDKWLSRPFGEKFRLGLLKNIYSIFKSGRDVFDSALVDSIVTTITKCEHNQLISINKNQDIYEINKLEKTTLMSTSNLDIVFSKHIQLIYKLENKARKLSEFVDVENACATSDCYKLQEFIYSLNEASEYDKNSMLKIVNTGTIGRYVPKWGLTKMKYLKNTYLFPVVNKQKFQKAFRNSYASKSTKKKLIIKGLTLLDACLDEDGTIIPGKSTIIVHGSDDDIMLALALINSKLSMFYVKERYSSASYNGGITFNKLIVGNLPITQKLLSNRSKLENLSRKIYLEKSMTFIERSESENLIDQIVFESFDLTEDEKNLINSLTY